MATRRVRQIRMLSMAYVQQITGLSKSATYDLLKRGLRHYRFGSSIRVDEANLSAFLEDHQRRADEGGDRS